MCVCIDLFFHGEDVPLNKLPPSLPPFLFFIFESYNTSLNSFLDGQVFSFSGGKTEPSHLFEIEILVSEPGLHSNLLTPGISMVPQHNFSDMRLCS